MSNPNLRRIITLMGKGATGITYATWDPANKNAGITLSGSNLVCTGTGSVKSTISQASNKWYWESTCTGSSSGVYVGVGYSGTALNGALGNGGSGFGYAATGDIFYNFGTIGTYTSYTTGDVIGVAIDPAAGTVKFYKNNVLQTTASGAVDAMFAQNCPGSSTTMTTNFGATALTYSPPGGYNAGLYV